MTIIYRKNHTISRKNISKNALKVLYRLHKLGYESYLVGGGVRDLLLGKQPKDFDITTNATPDQMKKLFRNCRLVGCRFRLAHIIFNSEIIEVSTFRGNHKLNNYNINNENSKLSKTGIMIRDNIFGNMLDDSQRRDLTINSLYYNIADFTIRDYVGGLKDLEHGIIRLIGNPEIRYREDPVRMLRVMRFVAKLKMNIESETAKTIPHFAKLLNYISPARLFDESIKLLQTGYGYNSYLLLRKYNLFQQLFPTITHFFTKTGNSIVELMLAKALQNVDNCFHRNNSVNPAFLFAAIFWYQQLETTKNICLNKNYLNYYDAFNMAISETLRNACFTLAIPKKITMIISDIWKLQLIILTNNNKKFIENSKFRAAYDLFLLRTEIENKFKIHNLDNWYDKNTKYSNKLNEITRILNNYYKLHKKTI